MTDYRKFFRIPYVLEYLSNNRIGFTLLYSEVLLTNYSYRPPDGLAYYHKYGQKYFEWQPFTYLLPSPLKLTRELVSWIIDDSDLLDIVYNAIGLRKLDNEEIQVLPKKNPPLKYFYDESGNVLKELEKINWVFSDFVGTDYNHFQITENDAFQFATRMRDVLFLITELETPDGWIKISDKIYLERNGSRCVTIVYSILSEILNSNIFNSFLQQSDAFVIMNFLYVFEDIKNISYSKNFFLYGVGSLLQ